MTIQLAFIASTPTLEEVSRLGDIEMALAHLVHTSAFYAAYFEEAAAQGRYIILDNGAYEMQDNGRGLDAAEVLEAAEEIHASEVVCTDVLYDAKATVEATKDFYDTARTVGVTGRYRFMGVVQGTTPDEFLWCYRELASLPWLDTLGFSKLSVPKSWGVPDGNEVVMYPRSPSSQLRHCRPRAITACTRMHEDPSFVHYPKRIHLLGGDQSLPAELKHYRSSPHKFARVRSNDSSFAFQYGAKGVRVASNELIAHEQVDELPNLRDGALDPEQMSLTLDHANLLRWCAQ